MVMHTRRALMGSLQLARRLLASDAAAAARLDSEGKDALDYAVRAKMSKMAVLLVKARPGSERAMCAATAAFVGRAFTKHHEFV